MYWQNYSMYTCTDSTSHSLVYTTSESDSVMYLFSRYCNYHNECCPQQLEWLLICTYVRMYVLMRIGRLPIYFDLQAARIVQQDSHMSETDVSTCKYACDTWNLLAIAIILHQSIKCTMVPVSSCYGNTSTFEQFIWTVWSLTLLPLSSSFEP